MTRDSNQRTKGVSLAKGPVAIIGLLGVIYGISALIFGSHGFALHVPHGAAHGHKWLGLEVNGWTGLLFIAAGLLLLFSAPLHWGAKSMSLLVGLVLAAAAVIAVIRGDGVFGIFAANHLTELVWGAAAVLLILLALLPRVGGDKDGEDRSDPVRLRPRAGATPEQEVSAKERRRGSVAARRVDAESDRTQQGITESPGAARAGGTDNHESQ